MKLVSDRLELPIAVGNVSSYLRVPTPGSAMSEAECTRAVVEAADCQLLHDVNDVNDVYVNAISFGPDPVEALLAMPLERAVQIHLAGHHTRDQHRAPTLLIDTHGAPIVDSAYNLLAAAARAFAERGLPVPTVLLAREHHLPSLPKLFAELDRRTSIHRAWATTLMSRPPFAPSSLATQQLLRR